jgi:hypothetical protein
VSGQLPFPEPSGQVASLPIGLERGEVLHFLGYPEGRNPPPRVEALLAESLAEARGLVRARGVFLRYPAERAAEAGLPPARATTLVLGLVTAGGGIEGRVATLLGQGEAARALLLDAAGSAAAEEAADHLSALALGESQSHRSQDRVSCRISPGYGDWPLAAQTAVFRLLPHEEVGVSLLPSLMMVPRKSVSFAMWLGLDGLPVPGLSGCDHCPLDRCGFRRGRRR